LKMECGWGAFWRDATGPDWDMVNFSFCKTWELEDKGSL
jgi:hypothetical protein